MIELVSEFFVIDDILYSFEGCEIDSVAAFEVVEREEFGFGVVDLIVFDIVPEGVVDFVFELKFYFELGVASWSLRVVG